VHRWRRLYGRRENGVVGLRFLFDAIANNQNERSVSARLREKRFALFVETLSVTTRDRILDVGGVEQTWLGSGLENRVTLLNLDFRSRHPRFSYVCADACNMDMIRENEFDVVFSNSVIEHVGASRQHLFAREVSRVGRRIWIQTPNRHFPIEPHFVFPCFQYLPLKLQRVVALRWPYSHYLIAGVQEQKILNELCKLKLLSVCEMRELFKDSEMLFEKFFGLTKSIIAVRSA
jgi:hypothetical protein